MAQQLHSHSRKACRVLPLPGWTIASEKLRSPMPTSTCQCHLWRDQLHPRSSKRGLQAHACWQKVMQDQQEMMQYQQERQYQQVFHHPPLTRWQLHHPPLARWQLHHPLTRWQLHHPLASPVLGGLGLRSSMNEQDVDGSCGEEGGEEAPGSGDERGLQEVETPMPKKRLAVEGSDHGHENSSHDGSLAGQAVLVDVLQIWSQCCTEGGNGSRQAGDECLGCQSWAHLPGGARAGAMPGTNLPAEGRLALAWCEGLGQRWSAHDCRSEHAEVVALQCTQTLTYGREHIYTCTCEYTYIHRHACLIITYIRCKNAIAEIDCFVFLSLKISFSLQKEEEFSANCSCQNVRFFSAFSFWGFSEFPAFWEMFLRGSQNAKITKYQSNKNLKTTTRKQKTKQNI